VLGTAGGVALAKRADSHDQPGVRGAAATGPSAAGSPSASTDGLGQSGGGAGSATPTATVEQHCTDQIKQNKRWVCLTTATFDGNRIVIDYTADFAGSTPSVSGGFHLHIYGSDGTNPPASVMGSQSSTPGSWYVEDQNPSIKKATSQAYRQAIGDDATFVCARIANADHRLVQDENGTFETGNCIPIQRG
jgi:hypothetical protein